jgi:ABC-type dipeptide/oligopeptide/nickel transport system permease subunit
MLLFDLRKLKNALCAIADFALAIPGMIAMALAGYALAVILAAIVFIILFIPWGGPYALLH